MSKIFISYRRDDTKDIVGRIFDYLVNHFERYDEIQYRCEYFNILTLTFNIETGS